MTEPRPTGSIQDLQRELDITNTVVAAIDRHLAVFSTIAAARDKDQARAAVAALLGVSDEHADVALNLQWWHLNEATRAIHTSHRDHLERELQRLRTR